MQMREIIKRHLKLLLLVPFAPAIWKWPVKLTGFVIKDTGICTCNMQMRGRIIRVHMKIYRQLTLIEPSASETCKRGRINRPYFRRHRRPLLLTPHAPVTYKRQRKWSLPDLHTTETCKWEGASHCSKRQRGLLHQIHQIHQIQIHALWSFKNCCPMVILYIEYNCEKMLTSTMNVLVNQTSLLM